MQDQTRDEELMIATAAGDREAFQQLVYRHQAAVFRYITAVESDRGRAEDALQETFLSVWRSASSWRGDAAVRNWIFTVARNAAMRRVRRRSGEPEHLESLEELGERAGWGSEDDPERMAIEGQRRERLEQALRSLSAGDRELLVLRELEGLTGQETALVLGITEGGQKAKLHRARLRLAAALRKELGDG